MPSRWFRSWRLPPLGGIPLRVALIAPYLLLVLGTAGLAGYSCHAVHNRMQELTGKLLQGIGQRIEQSLSHDLETARQLVNANVAALRLGILDARNLSVLEAYFFRQAVAFPTISGVMLTNEQKDFVTTARRERGWTIRVYHGARRDGLRNYQADARGSRQQLLWLDTGFDPHDDPPGNPWYAAVRNAGKPLWSLVVGEIEAGQTFLMLTRMAPFDAASGKFQGVTGVSLFLPQIGHFLQDLRISKTGQAFIVDRDGLLIATSTGEPPFSRRSEAGRDPLKLRLAAVESSNPATRAASRYLVDTAGGFQRLTGFQQFSALLNDQAYWLQVTPFSDENLDWRIIVVMPESEVMKQTNADMAKTIALHGVALILVLLLGLWIAGGVARPIRQLSADAGRLARNDFPESRAASPIAELQQLIGSFKHMARRLRKSFGDLHVLNQTLADHERKLETELDRRTATLRELNQHLEQRELERTADLMQMMALLNEEMQARQQGEQHLIQALRAARAGVWEWDAATDQTIWSDDSYRILGLTPGSVEACYENWLRCVHPDDRAEVKRQVAQTMARGGELNIEFRVAWPDGDIHWLNGIGQWQYDLAGQPISMVGIQIDITERKRAENALRETMALLEQEMQVRRDQEAQLIRAQKLEVVGRLTGGIAHDFNNLLTVIKGNLEILREQGPDRTDPDRALLVEDALSATRQGAELTAGLLAFSRQQPLRLQRTRVNRIVEGLERLLDRVLGPTVVLRVETDPALPDVRSDPGQLQAALMNLMLNAQDAMPEGGTLDVRTAIVDVRGGTAPPVADLNPGRYVVVTVADSGIGMDADTLARACEPFFTTKPFGKGTGLGLSTVYGFAAQSHGGLAIESQPGQGATVRLFLPAMEPPSERTAREMRAPLPAPLIPAGGTETILVVEDNARVRRLACRYLRDLGYTVLEAADADEAIAILETEPDIQMVFSDILMPGDLDGFDLAHWIAAHRPTVKRLLATGHHERARAVCADDPASPPVLAKPYSREQLAHQLRQLLDGEAGTSVRSLP